MQFTLRKLLIAFVPIACAAWCAGQLLRHWDLRSYYIGFYGQRNVPDWVTGTGRDSLYLALGRIASGWWPFIAFVGAVSLGWAAVIYCAQVKGGSR